MSVPRHVTVAVLTWNGRQHLEACLPALEAQIDPGVPWEILVLDNGSTDDTAAWARRHHPQVRLIRSEVNLGFCAGNNRLATTTDSDAVAFLNNDTRPAPTWLAALVSALAEAPDDVVAVSGLLTDWEGARLDCAQGVMTFDGHAFQLGHGRPLATAPMPGAGADLLFPSGGNMLIRRPAFLDVGGFDEDYFAYYDDVDLGWRVWSGGRRIIYAPEAVAAHRGGATGVRLGLNNRGVLFERNAFRTAYKNYEPALWEQMMPAVLLTLVSRSQALLEGNPQGALLAVDPYAGAIADTAPRSDMGGLERAPQPPRPSAPPRETRGAPRSDMGGLERAPQPPRPSAPPRGTRGAPRSPLRRAWDRVVGRSVEEEGALRITDERTIAQFRALGFVLRHLDGAAEKRAAVQARRRRSDREIFERFPLYVVPTYPGDEALFAGAGFRSWLPRDVRFVECTIADVMRLDR